jgi:toxin-antitoxin system PIN domain toxin
MLLVDVNVLVYAYREDVPRHLDYRSWLQGALESGEPVGLADVVLSGFLRITTHPRIFKLPSPLEDALRFTEALRSHPNSVHVRPGPRHWEIFTQLCLRMDAQGNSVPDTYLAALAVEAGVEWISTDRGFGEFPGLRWRHPLRESSS